MVSGATLLGPVSVEAATYYVSPSGSDSASGTSAASAWRTFSHATASGRLHAGDAVLLQGGGVWTTPLQPRTSGTANARIVFGTYGTGRPVIDGASSSADAGFITTAAYVTLRGVELRNWRRHEAIYLSNTHDVVIDGVFVHDSLNGIVPEAAHPSRAITITNVTIQDIGSASGGSAIYLPPGTNGVTVSDSTFARASDSCIIDTGADNTYRRIVVHDCGLAHLSFAAHDVYLKGPRLSVLDSDLSTGGADCITARYADDE